MDRVEGGEGFCRGSAKRFQAWAKRYDWRVWTIVVALIISVASTGAVYWIWGVPAPDTHWGSVFASWVGGVLLFLVVGLATALVSVAKPELESFDTRARILFRRQSGAHIDYIIARIKQLLEQYAETVHRKVIIEDYHEEEQKFRVATETTAVVRSYIDDITSTYASKVVLQRASPPPANGRKNRLVYLRVNNKSLGVGEEFDTDIERPFDTAIAANDLCEVKQRLEVWVVANTEANTYTPARYTQKTVLEVENNLHDGRNIVLKLQDQAGVTHDFVVAAGETRRLLEVSDLPPKKMVYDFRIGLA